jgi:hypothetical protein
MTAPPPTCFHPTPSWLIYGSLAMTGLLWASERYQWLSINSHKGWTVLIAVAALGAVLLLLAMWFVVALVFKCRFQFSIRSLLVLTVAVAVPFGWLGVEMRRARKQKAAVDAILSLGGGIRYAWGTDTLGVPIERSTSASASLQDLLGLDFFAQVVQAEFSGIQLTDRGLEAIRDLTQVRWLFLSNSKVTDGRLQVIGSLPSVEGLDLDDSKISDAGLKHLGAMASLKWLGIRGNHITDIGLEQLHGLTGLESLGLNRTQVTDHGVKKLQQALPNCKIYYR